MNREKYYITTAIAYTSGKPHIGNNYEIVLADSIARFKRKEGYDVFFQTGTDEHGQKIELKAQEAGVTPKEFVDEVAGTIRGLCDLLNISYDKLDVYKRQVRSHGGHSVHDHDGCILRRPYHNRKTSLQQPDLCAG